MIHPVTGQKLVRGSRRHTVRYKGLEREVVEQGWFPEDGGDGDGVLVGDDMEPGDRALAEIRAEIAATLQPHEVRAIRLRLKLSQRKASELLGGGPRAFQKYESGEVAVSKPMANLLRLLDRDPARLKELVKGKAA
jgi:HTH-type transcriptional regulator/antitoxin MqsA